MWTKQQEAALEEARNWYATAGRQVFRIFGWAGTGKSTIAREIAGMVGGNVAYGAYTGKAALVMRSKGCVGASTLHSLIYRVDEDEETGKPIFSLNPGSPLTVARLLIVDEVSMVGEQIGRDLESFGVPILVLGDPGQLPPISGTGYFTETDQPDVMLTEIHRQAQDNPILQLATAAREGRRLRYGDYGQGCRVIPYSEYTHADILGADQVLVGMNLTRQTYNQRFRELLGCGSEMPVVGDRLICLKNNREKGLTNGSMWTVREIDEITPQGVYMRVEGDETIVDVKVHPYFFLGREKELPRDRDRDEFTYGYAITVHKAQGSQWPGVMLVNESGVFRDEWKRWLYTGITRAAESITIVQ